MVLTGRGWMGQAGRGPEKLHGPLRKRKGRERAGLTCAHRLGPVWLCLMVGDTAGVIELVVGRVRSLCALPRSLFGVRAGAGDEDPVCDVPCPGPAPPSHFTERL